MNGNYQYSEASVSSLEPRDYPLHRAAFENNVDEARRLIKEGNIDIAKRNAAGDTALHVATMLGHKGEPFKDLLLRSKVLQK
jgi:ankyrin repeat protein